ncbi:SNF2 family N-terminal domain-containing protein [Pavlovales sp. CCMP2436]|nr:SNF2 family N-terminal domain-containing protein [Pavlovales sp. CCMP2436]
MPPRKKAAATKGSGDEASLSSSSDDDDFEPPQPRAKPKAAPAKRAKSPAAAKPKTAKAAEQNGEGEGDGPAPKKKKTKVGFETGNYFVEPAKTGRAKCQVCGGIIAVKEIRFGIEVDEASSWGVITRWQHLLCSRVPLDLDSRLIAGLDVLEPELQALARETLYSVAALPADEVDPDEVLRSSTIVHTEEREPPPSIVTPLLRFQKVGLAWMCAQEKGEVKGGILADEMGMGKTIQAISLIAAHKNEHRLPADRPPPRDHPALSHLMGGSSSGSASGSALCSPCTSAGGTLVVCPVIALLQWQAELLKCTDGSLSVFVYHGGKRSDSAADLAKFDIVLTTYSIIEVDFRKSSAHSKVACQYCARKFQPDKLEVHLRWFCGPGAKRSAAQSKTEKRIGRPQGKGKGKMEVINLESDEEEDELPRATKLSSAARRENSSSESGSEEEDDDKEEGSCCLSCGGAKSSAANPLLLCDSDGCEGGQKKEKKKKLLLCDSGTAASKKHENHTNTDHNTNHTTAAPRLLRAEAGAGGGVALPPLRIGRGRRDAARRHAAAQLHGQGGGWERGGKGGCGQGDTAPCLGEEGGKGGQGGRPWGARAQHLRDPGRVRVRVRS